MFVALVETGNYMAAGQQMHVAHSAIHRQVKLLAEEVGEQLLYREGRSIKLTAAGREVAELAVRVLNDIANATRRLRANRALETGRVALGTGTTMILYFLPRVLELLRKRHEGIEVQVMTGTAAEVMAAIRQGSLDLGIVFTTSESGLDRTGLRFEPLYDEEFVLIAPPSMAMAQKRSVAARELEGLPVITFSRTSSIRQFIDSRLKAAGVRMKVVMELENEEAIDQMVRSCTGTAFVSRSRARAEGLKFLTIKNLALRANASAVYSARMPLTLASQEFLNLCLRCARARS